MTKQRFMLIATSVLAACNVIGATPVQAAEAIDYFHFTGAFHPAVSHFPIGLLVVAGVVELWGFIRGRKVMGEAGYTCLVLGAAGAVVAATLGWANADHSGGANGSAANVLLLHRWLGVSVAVIAVILAAFATYHRSATELPRAKRLGLLAGMLACSGLVGFTGSLGGKLVYGLDYYEIVYNETIGKADKPVAPTPPVVPPDPSVKVSFATDIKPLFTSHCVKCHGESKQKADYRLDTKQFAFKPGESEEAPIVPGKADDSLLIKVIEGKGDYKDKMMPPKGDPLSTQQVALIRRWINEGAVWNE